MARWRSSAAPIPTRSPAHRPGAERRRRACAMAVAGPATADAGLLRRSRRRLGRAHRRRVGRPPAALAPATAKVSPAPERALDIGTGTGEAALFLAREFPRASVRGIDISEEMIREAQAKVGLDPDGRIAFRVADAAAPALRRGLVRPRHPGQHAAVLRRDRARAAPRRPRDRRRERGPATPFYTPDSVLERGFRRHGIEAVETRRGRARHLLRRPRRARVGSVARGRRAEPLPAARQPLRGRRARARAAAARPSAALRGRGLEYRIGVDDRDRARLRAGAGRRRRRARSRW